MKPIDERDPRQYYKQLLFRILAIFFVISLVPVGMLGYVSLANLNTLANESESNSDKLADESRANTDKLAQESKSNTDTLAAEIYQNNSEELKQQAIDDLLKYVIDKSGEWGLYFANMVENIGIIRDYATDLFNTDKFFGEQLPS